MNEQISEDIETQLRSEIAALRQEVTELRQREKILQESEHRLRLAIINSPLPMQIHAEDGEILLMNKIWYDLVGYQEHEISNISDWIGKAFPHKAVEVKNIVNQLYEITDRVEEGEDVITTKNGETKVWEFTTAPLGKLLDGRRVVISMAVDITERRKSEEELEHLYQQMQDLNIHLECQVQERTAQLSQKMKELEILDQLKDDFLSTVSHELRTPITNIKMAIQMLKISSVSEAREQYMQILQNECEREIKLIDELLDLQRLEADQETVRLEAIPLNNFLIKIIQPFKQRAELRQQIIQVDISSTASLISDSSLLERILSELLNNACKYTPIGELICINVYQKMITIASNTSKVTKIVISNSGTEIPQSELARIFDKFYRVSREDLWKQGGTGLGLALVKKMVELLGGKVSVESQDKQTIFSIELPELSLS